MFMNNLTKTRFGKVVAVYLSFFFVFISNPVSADNSLPRLIDVNSYEAIDMTGYGINPDNWNIFISDKFGLSIKSKQLNRKTFKELLIAKGIDKGKAEKISKKCSDTQIKKVLNNPELMKKSGFLFLFLLGVLLFLLGSWMVSKTKKSENNGDKNV